MKRKRKPVSSWVIVLCAIAVSCLISGVCCFIIYQPKIEFARKEETEAPLEEPLPEESEEEVLNGGALVGELPEEELPEEMETASSETASEASDSLNEQEDTPRREEEDVEPEQEPEPEPKTETASILRFEERKDKQTRYKIETIESRVNHIPCTVYARLCKRSFPVGDWVVVKEIGDPYWKREASGSRAGEDPLADVSFTEVGTGDVPGVNRSGYCWYGDSYFKMREEWLFFSGGRFRAD